MSMEEQDEVEDDIPTPQSEALVAPENLDEQQKLAIEAAIMTNNFGGLNVSQRMALVLKRCEKLGVDATQGPFVWGKGKGGKLMLIATKNLSQQLRANRNIKMKVHDAVWDRENHVYFVRVDVQTPDLREDSDIGAVGTFNMKGEALANAMMSAVTKGKNRATLSLCGVGGLDESELASIREVQGQRLFDGAAEGIRRIEPGPSKMNAGLLTDGASSKLAVIEGEEKPLVSKTGMPFAKTLVRAGRAALDDPEEAQVVQTQSSQTAFEGLKPTPLPVQEPPKGRVITARPPLAGGPPRAAAPGLVRAGAAPQMGNPPTQTSTPNPPAPRPPKASPVRAGGR